MQEDEDEEEDHLEAAVEEGDAETFDDSEFYQQLLKEFLEGSAVGSGAGALAASAGVRAISPLSATHYCHHSSEVTPSLGPKVTVKELQCTRVGRYPALHLAHLLAEQTDRARRFQHSVLIVK